MDLLDIISTVIEFSQKKEEYHDEIKTMTVTLESLQQTVRKVDPDELPPHFRKMLDDNLEESKELLKKSDTNSWWTCFKNMLPGSHLQKVKEKTQQLVHLINLLNLHLNTLAPNKRGLERISTCINDDVEEPPKLKKLHTISGEQAFQQPAPLRKSKSDSKVSILRGLTMMDRDDTPFSKRSKITNLDDDLIEDPEIAYRLKVIYDERLGRQLQKNKDFEPILEGFWEGRDNIEYVFQRLTFAYLPLDDAKKISRDHATLICNKIPNTESEEDKENEKVQFILKDLSLNGTYYLKKPNLKTFPTSGLKIKGEFKSLAKNEETELEHGDIIGLIMQKPHCKDLIFGFQLITRK